MPVLLENSKYTCTKKNTYIYIYLDILKSSTGNLKGSPATIICFPALYAEVKILYIKIVFLTLSQVDVYKLYNLIRAILYFQI